MPENPRIKIPFGDALDRESGLMVMRPGSMEDMRNVLLHEGSAVIRQGFGSELVLLDSDGVPMTHTVQGKALRSDNCGIVVAYQEVAAPVLGRVFVFKVDSDGEEYELVGEWEHDQGGWGATPPVISMDESYGKVFMAHDQRIITVRAQTMYYDPADGALHGLRNDFTVAFDNESVDGGGSPTRFRSVCKHLNYLFGLAYGTELLDRPELLRSSLPGEPTVFQKEHWAIVGNQRDPILRAVSCGSRLGVLKAAEGYPFFGTNRDDFGVSPAPVDPRFGVLCGGLAVNYGGFALVWGAEGPRMWDFEGPSQDIAMPLDLLGPEPATLVAQGETAHAFACYIPGQRIVAFVFGRRVYAFSVRNEESPRWAGYWELDREAYCAFTLYAGQQISDAPVGLPRIDLIDVVDGEVDDYEAGGTFARVTVKNLNQEGDEIIEAYIKSGAESVEGVWSKHSQYAVQPTATQVITIEDLVPGTDYTLAVRYKRGVTPSVTHRSTDPAQWPSVSRGWFVTSIDPPWISGAVWSRTAADSERITLTIVPATDQESQDIEIWRDGEYLATVAGPHNPAGFEYADINPYEGESVLFDELARESPFEYTCVTLGESAIESIPSVPFQVWGGPAGKPIWSWVLSRGPGYEVGLDGAYLMDAEVWDNYDNNGGIGVPQERFTIAAGLYQGASGALANVVDPLIIDVQFRFYLSSFGVDDWGEMGSGLYLRTVEINSDHEYDE